MKRQNLLLALSLAILFASSFTNLNAQIQSTTGGGAWNDTLTWDGWRIPGAVDDVVIIGPVDVTGAECKNLMVQPTGILQNRSYTNYTLRIHGSITNNGIIRNYPDRHNLYLTVDGDIFNNGEWSNSYTYLTGSSDQNLSFTHEFSGYRLEDSDSESAIIASTDLTFKGTKIDLKGGTLALSQGGKLYINGEWLFNGNVVGNGSEIYLLNNAFLERVTVDDVSVKGVINVFSSVAMEEESVIDLDK
jgi:hypothetical protein